jgi:hypothetical protein
MVENKAATQRLERLQTESCKANYLVLIGIAEVVGIRKSRRLPEDS